MLNFFIEVLDCFAEIAIAFYFLIAYFGFKFLNKKKEILFTSTFLLILLSIDIIFSQKTEYEILSALLCILISFIYCLIALNGKPAKKLLFSVINVFLMLTTSIIALSALTAFANGDYVLKTVILFATKVLYFLLGSLFLSLLKKNKTKLSIPERGFMLIIFIATFISLLTMWNVEWELSFKLGIKNSLLASIMSICLLIISILLYFLFVRISKNNAEREKLRLLNLKNSTELKIYDEISVQYNKLNCIRHDLKHHASLIKDNLDAGNVPEIYKYLSDLDNELSETCTIYTKNSIVDLVLNSKFLSAKNKGITPYYDINITNLEKITKHANQIGIVLGNLLDNAITATLPSGEIKLSIFNRRNFLVIVLENSIKPNSITDIKKLETTNPDKENHGFGLISVRNTVEKLNGSLNISIDNDSFLVEIVI